MLWFFGIVAILGTLPAFCSSFPPQYEKVEELSQKGEYAQALEQLDVCIREGKGDDAVSRLLLEKAKLLYKDQKQKEAQEVFLQAVEKCQVRKDDALSPREAEVLQSLIPLYLAMARSSDETHQFEEKVQEVLRNNPKFYSIKYFLASCAANRNDFVSFFDQFFEAYQERPQFYLAWKMQGVLHLRLFEASSEENARIRHREKAVEFLQKAFSLEPKDASLIAKLVFLLPRIEKKKFLEDVFHDLSQMNNPLQRSECIYLIQQALEVNSIEVAKRLIGKANIWYEYSRAIQELSKQIED